MSAENDAICGQAVNSDPGAPCTYPPNHVQWWHTHDGASMPRSCCPNVGFDACVCERPWVRAVVPPAESGGVS